MERNKKILFSDKNHISSIAKEESFQLENYLEVVRSFSRLTYESIYVIDYKDMVFEFVSDNPLFLCGHTPAEVQESGYDFYLKNVHPDDLELLTVINTEGFNFFDKLPNNEDRKSYTITYDFRLINEKGKPMLISHKLTPVFLTNEGKIWKAICVVSLSNNQKSGNIIISKQGSGSIWKLDTGSREWLVEQKQKLSPKEIEILRLYTQGYSINQIAEMTFVTSDTVKYHRRKIFENFGVSNITEALFYAINNKLI
ncbi:MULTISPECIES: LuxR C-terminal-related transcriptional regulator [Flavobacterium]|uniref:LuxR C-terminal-related transcriptional regulator n=1 Tax=Flavobacterium TaxID=237 RepID=UPI00086BBAEE|nr:MULTISPECIES: LuxR C-terminal-related transcriptional regulator [Flavobacterium]MBN9284831.1 helix-turn-helix transcriptional regulator [Flavobacterium sp.]ODS77378.1 MAG: helix-turn-helix transcriptional regulator [Chryseobacterium sp. SCN 40-13]OJV71326.1 MAG: helix-turn-helix transcriptional regulator [Flavobacterium sp. 40-81]